MKPRVKGSATAHLGLGDPITPEERELLRRAWRVSRARTLGATFGEWVRRILLRAAYLELLRGPW